VKTVYRRDAGRGPASRETKAVKRLLRRIACCRREAHACRRFGRRHLLQILQDIGDCRRCRLHEGRNKIVFRRGQ
jgi:ribosomal protein L37AE/L43A